MYCADAGTSGGVGGGCKAAGETANGGGGSEDEGRKCGGM